MKRCTRPISKLKRWRLVRVVKQGVRLIKPAAKAKKRYAELYAQYTHLYPALKDEVNSFLKGAGRTFSGASKLSHLVPFLHDEVGLGRIKGLVKNDFKGMRVAIHYGCHMMRPSHSLKADDPHDPKKFDRIVEALGAESVVSREGHVGTPLPQRLFGLFPDVAGRGAGPVDAPHPGRHVGPHAPLSPGGYVRVLRRRAHCPHRPR